MVEHGWLGVRMIFIILVLTAYIEMRWNKIERKACVNF